MPGKNVLGASTTTQQCHMYQAKPGDSLWSVAKTLLHNPLLWTQIKKQNNLPSTLIHSGQKLKINC
jgi:LysM repeat protein